MAVCWLSARTCRGRASTRLFVLACHRFSFSRHSSLATALHNRWSAQWPKACDAPRTSKRCVANQLGTRRGLDSATGYTVTMKSKLYASVVLCFALCTFALSAKEKQHLPLPATVLAAKTVFIDNQTGMAKLGDRAYEELKKWGRFQIVSDRKQADLIFLLTA